jgi:hypothetical protein
VQEPVAETLKVAAQPVSEYAPAAAAETPRSPDDRSADRGARVYQVVEPKVPGARNVAGVPEAVADATLVAPGSGLTPVASPDDGPARDE